MSLDFKVQEVQQLPDLQLGRGRDLAPRNYQPSEVIQGEFVDPVPEIHSPSSGNTSSSPSIADSPVNSARGSSLNRNFRYQAPGNGIENYKAGGSGFGVNTLGKNSPNPGLNLGELGKGIGSGLKQGVAGFVAQQGIDAARNAIGLNPAPVIDYDKYFKDPEYRKNYDKEYDKWKAEGDKKRNDLIQKGKDLINNLHPPDWLNPNNWTDHKIDLQKQGDKIVFPNEVILRGYSTNNHQDLELIILAYQIGQPIRAQFPDNNRPSNLLTWDFIQAVNPIVIGHGDALFDPTTITISPYLGRPSAPLGETAPTPNFDQQDGVLNESQYVSNGGTGIDPGDISPSNPLGNGFDFSPSPGIGAPDLQPITNLPNPSLDFPDVAPSTDPTPSIQSPVAPVNSPTSSLNPGSDEFTEPNLDPPKPQNPTPDDTATPERCSDPCIQGLHDKLDEDQKGSVTIKVKVFVKCKKDENEALGLGQKVDSDGVVYTEKEFSVPKSEKDVWQSQFDESFELRKLKCNTPEISLEIPETMVLRVPDGRPILKLTYREIDRTGKQSDSKWTVQVPWFLGAKHNIPKVEYQHGSYQVRYHFQDGSKITVNAKDQKEGKRAISRLLKSVQPDKVDGGYYAYSPPKTRGKTNRNVNELREIKLTPTNAAYYPKGDGYVDGVKAAPEWSESLTNK